MTIGILYSFSVTIAVCSGSTRHGIVDLIDRVVDHVQINVKPHQVTLITESSEVLSPASQLVARRVVGKFRSQVLGTEELWRLENQRLSRVKRSVATFFTRSTMKIVVLDAADEKTAIRRLMDLIDFLDEFFVRSTRPKCLIFLVNEGRSLYLRGFFKYAWTFKFIDISVVELFIRDDKRAVISSTQYANSYAVVHQYNPFIDVYKKNRLSLTADLFPKKTRNLYGHVMRIGFLDTFPQVMFHKNLLDCDKNVWRALYGLDVFVSRILASTLNFSVKVVLINSGDEDLSCFNVSRTSYFDLLRTDDLDYYVNFYYLSGRQLMSDFNAELTTFLYYDSVHLVIKQYGFPVINVQDLVYASGTIFIFVLLLLIFIKLMRIGDRTWTLHNILSVALGNSVTMSLDNSTRRVIFMTLTSITVLFSSVLMGAFNAIYTDQNHFFDLQTLQDVLDSGIVPSITQYSKDIYSSSGYAPLKKLMNLSKTVKDPNWNTGMDYCMDRLGESGRDGVNGCELDYSYAMCVSAKYSKSKDYVVSFVREPLGGGMSYLFASNVSPYVESFNVVFRALRESGIVNKLQKKVIRECEFGNDREVKNYSYFNYVVQEINDQSKLDEDGKMILSSRRIALFFLVGYFLAGTAFLFEVFLKICESVVLK